MPAEQRQRNDVEPEALREIIAAVAAGDLPRAYELTPPELADRLSISGTPRECADKIRREIEPTGVNHMILAITDSALVKAFTGMDLPGIPDTRQQLRHIREEVMPAFAT